MLFVDGWSNVKNRWNSIFRILGEVYLYIVNLNIDACQLLLALNNNPTININLFSWSTLFQWTDLENQWAEGITQFIGLLGAHAWRTQLELKWQSYDRVGRVVMLVVI